ncbi:AmmeMemoRadiSam system protein A [Sulfurimonas diazotrophicus]|uniref:AmmeMemoRadiSam system protein A n=1 Tax=Sulfurimonas diazotrophicus TaxID=3131939 RepID=A0ABZ3HAA9_9BACT
MTLQTLLLQLARAAITSAFGEPFPFNKAELVAQFPELDEPRATFVTLKIGGKTLRGCIGSIIPHTSLYEDVIANAKSAAFSDPRFASLTDREYRRCSVEVSLLSVPENLPYDDAADLRRKIRPNVDGVILQLGGRSATFLPQVWEELPDFDAFFAHLGLKAGLGTDVLNHHPEIFTYQAEHFEDAPLQTGGVL